MKNILVIGSGGREHALALSLSRGNQLGTLYAFPGNAGIAEIAKIPDLDLKDFSTISDFCLDKNIALVVIGPEQFLVEGLSDFLRGKGIKVFGCSAKAAQLEASKSFTKNVCDAKNIKTAAYKTCYSKIEALEYLKAQNEYPSVIKADGLAAGKGVVIVQSEEEAVIALNDIFSGKYSEQSKVVIEEFLTGVEASFFALSDGKVVRAFGTAGDHKKIGEGETGPNTGGMGTYSPSPFIEDEEQILQDFIKPTIDYLNEIGEVFQGILFLGLMLTDKGPYLIEYNVRFGDPEAQSILARLDSDFIEIAEAVASGRLEECDISFSEDKALTVVLAAKGYPDSYKKNTEIKNSEKLKSLENIILYHAGTKRENGKLLANGGRVLNVTAKGSSFQQAYDRSYAAVKLIDWDECYYRNDIGAKVIS